MKLLIIQMCFGIITNQHVTLTDGWVWVEFTTGTVTACKPEIKVKKENGDLVAYWKSDGKTAVELYKNFESLTLPIMRIK